MRMRARAGSAAVLTIACAASGPGARPEPREADGLRLHDGWTIRPAGRAIDVGTFPMAVAPARRPGRRLIRPSRMLNFRHTGS